MVDQAESGRPHRPLQVLIVDDNADAADSLALVLGLWGYQVRVAYDGPAAIREAEAQRPDCLFLDIGLPGIDGYTLARDLRARPQLGRAKFIALTAYSDEAHLARARDAGFDHHLVKPADLAQIERLLNMLKDVFKLVERTEELAVQTNGLAAETKELLQDVKQDIREVKQEVKELREEIREVKHELKLDEA